MKSQTEIELKFLVPQASRAALVAELAGGTATVDRTTLAAQYLDTDDRRLARLGLAWRLRREGRRWVQTLKAGGANALERFEHEVMRPDGSFDAAVHAGTPPGDQLIAALRGALDDGMAPVVRFRTEVRRTARRYRTRGAVVEVAFDEGRIVSGESSARIREIEFELVSGSPLALLRFAERWQLRHGLIHDPHSKAERGNGLADGTPFPPLRKASRPRYDRHATPTAAFGQVLDECLAQINRNATGLIAGDPAQRIEHVHQMRVGIRRLRSALRSFQGWVPTPPVELVEGLRSLFATLGLCRDSDVLKSGVFLELARAGAPALELPPGPPGPDPVEVIRNAKTQGLLLAWISWRVACTLPPPPAPESGVDGKAFPDSVPEHGDGPALAEAGPAGGDDARAFRRGVGRRLRRWHARIAADWHAFDTLDDAALHALRKRIKRQRYAIEFFAPLLRRGEVARYLDTLSALQDRMGGLNDLFVARARYQALDAPDPAAWFALGWLSARIAEVRALAKPELARLANADPPTP